MKNYIEESELGFKVIVPQDWKYKKLQTGYIFGHPTLPGLLMLLFHYNQTLGELTTDMEAGFYDDSGFNLQVDGELKIINESTILAEYNGSTQGMPARGYSIGRLSPFGGGILVAAIANPDHFTDDYYDFVDEIALQAEFFEPETSSVADEWESFLKNKILDNFNSGAGSKKNIKYVLNENGTFTSEFNVEKGQQLQEASLNGKWEVVDVMDQPILSLTFFDGTERQYSLNSENGELYLNNEHWEMYEWEGE